MTATVQRVTPPQPRGIIPPTQARRLADATRAREQADEEFRTAVVAALKAGGSIREVAELSGLSTRTVQDWGHAGGWPTKAQKAAREEARVRRAEQLARHLERYELWRSQRGQSDPS